VIGERNAVKPTKTTRGISILEVIVLLALLVGVGGVVVPLVAGSLEDSKLQRALSDAGRIGAAVRQFTRDVGFEPGTPGKNEGLTILFTSGKLPSEVPPGPRKRLADALSREAIAAEAAQEKWKGPYLGEVGTDPWGRAYVVVQGGPGDSEHVWILSAGANGRVETSETQDAIAGDDIGIQLR